MSGYKYYISGSPARYDSVKETLIGNFETWLSEDFSLASDVFTIQEETSFASGKMQDVTVRINHGISTMTRQKLGDDFKSILFSDLDHSVNLGGFYYFDNNYWLTYNTEKTKNLATSVLVRRCNNVLRWVDQYGNNYEEYCSIDYNIRSPEDSSGTVNPVEPNGFITIYTQLNSDTKKIKDGQRFLFGNTDNWVCFKVVGGGVRNFLNDETEDSDSTKILQLIVAIAQINPDYDNLVLGIADYNKISYVFSASPTSYEGKVGDTFILDPNLEVNGFASDKTVIFTSSASEIISVDENGLVELSGSGSATITMAVEDNVSASSSILVACSGSSLSSYDIRVSPSDGLIYDGETQTFTVQAYYGGTLQPITFDFEVSSGSLVPATKYSFSVTDGSSFIVKNEAMYLDYPLTIRATSGSLIKDINIELLGAW